MKIQYTHVIWDFNGTILSDMQAGIDSINQMLRERDLPMLRDLEEYRRKFHFPVESYYRCLGFDFKKEDYHTCLAPLWVSLYLERSKAAPLFKGVAPLAAALRQAGVSQSILSASQRDMMLRQLSDRGAVEWFDEIWGTDSIHAYGKTELAMAWREKHPDAKAVLLGDTIHDFVVAESIGADCILVAAGHQDRTRLENCGVPVVDELEECLPLII